LQSFGKSLSRQFWQGHTAKALAGVVHRPQLERFEDRTLLSATNQALVSQMYQDLLVCCISFPASRREYPLLRSREEVFRSAEARPLAAD
jgi:hypothetical protein